MTLLKLGQAQIDAGLVGGEPFNIRHLTDILRRFGERRLRVGDNRRAFEKVVGAQSIREASGPAGGQDMRGSGDVIPQCDRGVVAQEDRARVLDFAEQLFGMIGGDVQVLGGELVGHAGRFFLAAGQHQSTELFQRSACEITPLQFGELLFQFGYDLIDERRMPGDQHARAGAVLGLRNQVAGDEVGFGGLIGEDDNFTRTGDAVDIDRAEDLTFGEGDEQVAGADDFIDRRESFDAIGHRGDRLGTPDAVHLLNAQLVASGQQVGVVAAEFGRWCDNDDFRDTGDLRGDGGHQQCGGIRGRSTRYANSDAGHGEIALPEFHPRLLVLTNEFDIIVEDGALELFDVVANATHGRQICGGGRGMGLGHCLQWYAKSLAGEFFVIELLGILQQGGQTLIADIIADADDNLFRRERFAEEFDGLSPARLRNEIATRAEPFAECGEMLLCVVSATIDDWNVQGLFRHAALAGRSEVRKTLEGCVSLFARCIVAHEWCQVKVALRILTLATSHDLRWRDRFISK